MDWFALLNNPATRKMAIAALSVIDTPEEAALALDAIALLPQTPADAKAALRDTTARVYVVPALLAILGALKVAADPAKDVAHLITLAQSFTAKPAKK